MSKIRILLADDHTVFREGIRMILEAQADIEVIGEAAEGQEVVYKTRTLRPVVVLMDIEMPGMNGLEATRLIKKDCPEVQVLMLTVHETDEYFFCSLNAGASGYVPKRAASTDLIAAVQTVARGEVFLYPSVATKLVADYVSRVGAGEGQDSYDRLTPRERQVLPLIAEGDSDGEIAEQLVVSPNTVQSHRQHIMKKWGLHNRTELIKYAIRRGLIDLNA